MNTPAVLRCGDGGDAVRDLQERLNAAGHPVTVDANFGPATEAAVRAFQTDRRLRADGISGPQTFSALVEAGFQLGDRMLYLRQPMLRGDDVTELQRRLNGLGFDAGREDGILGPETERAIRQFQRDARLIPDGVFGPETRTRLQNWDALAGGSIASVREREDLRHGRHRLAGRKVYLAVEPGLAALASAVMKGLADAGADVVAETSVENDSVLAADANRFAADVFLAIRTGDAENRCSYFANAAFRSEAGYRLAEHLDAELQSVLGTTGGTIGRSYPALRETRMAAVVCEIVPRDDAAALQRLVARNHDVAMAIVRGVRQGVERPLDSPC
ncbi:MAG: putative peptidoglycan-binding protein [Actinomycetia bacterium]|nr:putative peptidoglycan-binding protein [Actinomycetes bacterium]